jgi:hypothetical protein
MPGIYRDNTVYTVLCFSKHYYYQNIPVTLTVYTLYTLLKAKRRRWFKATWNELFCSPDAKKGKISEIITFPAPVNGKAHSTPL